MSLGEMGWLDSSAGQIWSRTERAIQRGVVGFFRQSTMVQARKNTGSQKVQEEQLKLLEPFGIQPAEVQILLAYGESGRPGVVRKKYEELLELVRTERVGLVVLARHDRLGRDSNAAGELFQAMRETGTLIMVDGRVYDPADPGDDFVLSIHAKFAEIENRARARWIAMSRFAKARRLQFRLNLPVGLVWADPTDATYLQRLEDAGLIDWLEDLSGDRTACFTDDKRYHVLPFPDAEVHLAMRLTVEWLLETGNLRKVLRRIEGGHRPWPRRGLFPTRGRTSVFSATMTSKWTKPAYERLYDSLRSPALSGTYSYRAISLMPRELRGVPRKAKG